MPLSFLGPYTRTILVAGFILLLLSFSFSGMRADVWVGIQPLFEWMETTWFGVIGKTWGAAFATVEAVHLLGLALLGGSVLVSSGRLLGLGFNDLSISQVEQRAGTMFNWALATLLVTGIFMACGVAMKIYYLPVYWYKMLALGVGILFEYFVRRPLLARGGDDINPWIQRGAAISSIMIWFTVAATGRWIGFSG